MNDELRHPAAREPGIAPGTNVLGPLGWAALKRWLSRLCDQGAWLALGPLAVMFVVFWEVAIHSQGLLCRTIKFWEYLAYGAGLAVLGYWAGATALLRLFRSPWPAVLFAWFYLFLYGVNTAILYHAGTVLEPNLVQMADWTNWMVYVTKWVYGLLGLVGLMAGWTWVVFRRHAGSLKALPLATLLAALVVLWGLAALQARGLFRPTYLLVKAAHQPGAGAWQDGQTDQLRMLARNPLSLLARALFSRGQALARRPVSELARAEAAVRTWHLALGPRIYPPLGLGPFDQIVVLGSESLSLDFLTPYNTNLSPDLTPCYGSAELRQGMLENYWTTALPTQAGLLATYNSHPNAAGLRLGQCELSLVKMLNQAGYYTCLLKSDSETFLDDRSVFRNAGFQEVSGMETWIKDPRKNPSVEGRGLMDRVLYETVLEYLEKYRGRKILIHVTGQDTHSPNQREHYGSLVYPPTPPAIQHLESAEARGVMEAIFRHDYDVGLALKGMRERGLLTAHTLVIITADHNYPQSLFLKGIPGYPHHQYYTRIPFCLLSGQTLPPLDKYTLHTQLDFAPTVAHLLGLPIAPGWWGQSLFATHAPLPHLAEVGDHIIVDGSGPRQAISLAAPQGEAEESLVRLWRTLLIAPKEAPSISPQKR